jgi:uncharacterized cysteine cluster protein YcgN (CxxCxxCC family)
MDKNLLLINERSCDACTKCCDGWLSGNAHGHDFYSGKPCHFVATGKGCSIYNDRPKEPCQTFKCAWLLSKEIPEWMKPDKVNAIISVRNIKNFQYLSVKEAGEKLRVEVLSWLVSYVLQNNMNLHYEINGGSNYLGSNEFIDAINLQKDRIENEN